MKTSLILTFLIINLSGPLVYSGATTDKGKQYEQRWNKFKALTDDQRSDIHRVETVCGKVLGEVKCSQLVGRSIDAEDDNCDKFCCSQGFLMGFCKKDAVINPNMINDKLNMIKVVANCQCSNDWRDANCGPDGRFLGISCPIDSSACRRNCCRDGKQSGSCGGFLRTKCKCN